MTDETMPPHEPTGARPPTAAAAGRIRLGADLTVARMGFGAMRLTGPGIWGEPADPARCRSVLRRAVDLGVELIDTADSYGPEVSEQLIRDALHPYPAQVVIATKGGLTRPGPGRWEPCGRPEYLRQCVEMSLRRLGLERIDLYQFHRPDPQVPLADSLGALAELQAQGKIRSLGVSNVTADQLAAARSVVEVVSVQNRYNLTDRSSDEVLSACEDAGTAFLPWAPVAGGELAHPGGPIDAVASARGLSVAQLSLAWLLRRSPVMVPIPGTADPDHLDENVAAASVELRDDDWAAVEEAAQAAP